jgi:hypothetical protein
MSDLPAEQNWMILVELLTDLRKKGVEIPSSITEDVRMARTTLNFYKVDPTDPERMIELKRINDFLNLAQDALLTMADDQGEDYLEEWLDKLKRASRGEQVYQIIDKKSRFVVGAPSGFSMTRITFKKPISEDRVQEIAEYHNVNIEFEEDHILLIFGDKENIKESLKEISSFFKEQIE